MTCKRADDGWGNRHGLKWSEDELAKLMQLRFENWNWDFIAQTLKRSKQSCMVKYHYETHGGRKYSKCRDEVRIARKVDYQPRTDLTGIICGDPAPGRSALEFTPRQSRRPISLAPVSMGVSA